MSGTNRLCRLGLILVSAVMFTACGAAPGSGAVSEPGGPQAIVNGVRDGGRHPQVCALGGLTGEPATPFYEWCSGTLVAPDVILTAAHCKSLFDSFESMWAVCTTDGGGSTAPALRSGTFIPIPGASEEDGPGFLDAAVFVLDLPLKNARLGFLPPVGFVDRLYASPWSREHLPLTMVGFGLLGLDDTNYTEPRMMTHMRVTAVDDLYVWSKPAPGMVCYGDSGGPAFIAGTPIIAAATYGVDPECQAYAYSARLDRQVIHDFLRVWVPYLR